MDFQVKDTQGMQMESLRMFMISLSYVPARKNGGFISDSPYVADKSQISTRNAINLHNLDTDDWVQIEGKDLYTPAEWTNVPGLFEITGAGVAFLQNVKLVQRVKFIPTKKAPNGFIVSSHMVKPASPEVAAMFEEYLADPETPNA